MPQTASEVLEIIASHFGPQHVEISQLHDGDPIQFKVCHPEGLDHGDDACPAAGADGTFGVGWTNEEAAADLLEKLTF